MTDLLATFANPEMMHSLSAGEKLTAGLFTTLFGMGITFTALIILQFTISLLDKLLNTRKKVKVVSVQPVETAPAEPAQQENSEELVAAIATALAIQLGTSPEKIVIRNITPVRDDSPAWNRAGIIEQMQSRF